ncbi:MAG: glycosyltransferase [Acidobacteriota bacterium]|nr:glycosyltransferase [Acidobacteriota bacterium]
MRCKCARNLGARSSYGEYLAFLDSDDVLLPQKLEHQLASMSAHPESGMIFGSTEYWYDWDTDASPREANHIPPLAPGGKLYSPPTLLTSSYPLGSFGAPCIQSFLIRRSAFDRVGGFDECFNPSTFQLFEDIAFLAKIYLSVSVFVSDSCLDRYRCHASSMWHRAKGKSIEESARKFYFQWMIQYLQSHGIADRDIWRAVRKEAWVYDLPLSPSLTRIVRRIANRFSSSTSPNG